MKGHVMALEQQTLDILLEHAKAAREHSTMLDEIEEQIEELKTRLKELKKERDYVLLALRSRAKQLPID
jgi:uncharacterized protein (DUF3084 family)